MPDVPNDPHDLPIQIPSLIVPEPKAFAEWIFIGKDLLRQRFTYNDHWRSASGIVASGEIPAAEKRDAKRAKMMSGRGIISCAVTRVWLVRPSHHLHICIGAPSEHGQIRRHSGGLHSGQRFQPLTYLLEKSGVVVVCRIPGRGHDHT